MKMLVDTKLSEHKYKSSEGYLICVDSIIGKVGKQEYQYKELFQDSVKPDNEVITVDRPKKEVFSEETIASFENKPITLNHPDENVNSRNYNDYAVGFIRDVHPGKYGDTDVLYATLVITDEDAITMVENGIYTELSCGYDCDIVMDGSLNYYQKNIRGNHIALCKEGRAEIAKIIDSKNLKRSVNDKKMIDRNEIKHHYIDQTSDRMPDRMPERKFSDRMPERRYVDRMPDRMPERRYVDRMPERRYVDRMPDRMPERRFSDRMPERRYVDRMPERMLERRFSDRMPERRYVDRMPDRMPERRFSDRMPERCYVDRMPERMLERRFSDRMPERRYVDRMPERRYVDRMPERRYVDRMSERRYVDRMPERRYVDRMSERRYVDRMPKDVIYDTKNITKNTKILSCACDDSKSLVYIADEKFNKYYVAKLPTDKLTYTGIKSSGNVEAKEFKSANDAFEYMNEVRKKENKKQS